MLARVPSPCAFDETRPQTRRSGLGWIFGRHRTVLHGLGRIGLPSSVHKHTSGGRGVPPSVGLLVGRLREFSAEFRTSLNDAVRNRFGLELPDSDEDQSRLLIQDAFFLCRADLVAAGLSRYAEQYQGMYALNRGLSLACYSGMYFYLGWWFAAPGRAESSASVDQHLYFPLALLVCALMIGGAVQFYKLLGMREMLPESPKAARWLVSARWSAPWAGSAAGPFGGCLLLGSALSDMRHSRIARDRQSPSSR